LPPEDDEFDEEGRFFGSGVSKDTQGWIDYVNERDEETKVEKVDTAWLRKTALSFEKKISKNAELRAKFEGDPQKFMSSEADLDSSIKALSILSEHSELYSEFAELGCVNSLVSLLSHENTDIAIGAIEIISELTDEDVDAKQDQWDALVDALLEADLLDLLIANTSRFNEDIESDRSGVYHVLEVLESLASNSTIADKMGQHKSIIPWLLSRGTRKEQTVSQNKQYAAEVLAILLQSSDECKDHFIKVDGMDSFLLALSAYRKRDPAKDTEEEEYVENVFDSVTCVVDLKKGKDKFIEAEGIELCLIMVKEGKMSRSRALRLLDHALGGTSGGGSCCEKIIEAAGLKPLFTIFMKKQQDPQILEHLLGIFASMLRSLPGESAPRIRLLGKFMEKDYEKIDRLFQLRREYTSRLSAVDNQISAERKTYSTEEQEELSLTWLSQRLDAGLFSLQVMDTILAWLIAEDDGAKAKIVGLLKDRDEDLSAIRETLQEQLDDIGNDVGEEEKVSRDILTTLIGFLN
jgi:beta-catenin-like protein 1